MPTTNIPQILSHMLDPSKFSRKDQYTRITSYTLALGLPKHVTQIQLSKYLPFSQSSISRTLSTSAISTQMLTDSRIQYVSAFLDSLSLKPKYLILDETVMKRYGKKRIEKMARFYSSIEKRPVDGIQLIQSLLWINSKLYFPLFSDMTNAPGTSIEQFISMLDKVTFDNLILLVDGGITCAKIYFKAIKKGYTFIGRVKTNMNVVLNGRRVSLNDLTDKFIGVYSVVAYVPEYKDWLKIVFDNRMETRMNEKDKKGRVILCSNTTMSDFEILKHYSKRTYIEVYFKFTKDELGLRQFVYSAKSMLRHVELVEMYFTIWMVSQFWRNVKDRLGLRDFVERMRIIYYVVLFRLIAHNHRFRRKLESFLSQTCII